MQLAIGFTSALKKKKNPNFKLKFNNFIYAPVLKLGWHSCRQVPNERQHLGQDAHKEKAIKKKKLPIKISPAVLLFLSAFCHHLLDSFFGPNISQE